MTVQSDKWIKKMAKDHSMIVPFKNKQVRENKISIKIGARYKLKDAVQAHKDLENRKTTGSILLMP